MSSGGGGEQKGWRQSNSHQNRQSNSRGGGTQQRGPRNQELQPTTQNIPTTHGGAWSTIVDRSRSTSGARGAGGRSDTPNTSAATSSISTSQTQSRGGVDAGYTPVGGFNTADVKEYLRRVQSDAVAGDLNRAAQWKPTGDNPAAKAGSPWGSKPSVMANGQDFWVQLKKQIAAQEKGNIGG